MFKKYLIFSIPLTFSLVYCLENEADISFDDITITGQQQIYHGKSELKTYTKAGSYSYLDQAHIQRFRGSSVGDFLSGIPGVFVTNKRNSGAITVNIRGLQNENRVPVIIDGAFRSTPSWQGYAGSSTRTYLDPDLLSNVEIQKGVSFGADGVGATGGVIRMKTIGWEDIIPDDKDWGFRIAGGMMSNTNKKPPLYTRGGYRTKWVDKCKDEDDDECKAFLKDHPQTYDTPARYQNGNLFQNLGKSWNGSLAFAKKWENADMVLGYARKYQGNYFAGKHGSTPKIIGTQSSQRFINGKPNPNFNEFLPTEIEDLSKYEKYYSRRLKKYVIYPQSYDIISKKLVFDKNNYTYYRAGEEVLNTFQENKSYLAKLNLYNDFHTFNFAYSRYESNFGELMPSQTSIRSDGALQGEGGEVIVDSFSTGYRYNPQNPYVDLKFNTFYTKNDTSLFMPFIEDLVDLDENSMHSKSDSRYASFLISKQLGFSLQNTSTIELINQPLMLNYGVSYFYERFTPPNNTTDRLIKKNYPNINSPFELAKKVAKKLNIDPNDIVLQNNSAVGKLYERDARRDEISAFLWAKYPVLEWLEADFGLRYINARIKDNNPLEQCINGTCYVRKNGVLVYSPTKIYTPDIKTNAISPALMLTFKPNDNINLYIKYAKAVRNPSLFQATKGFGQQNQGEKITTLKPEEHFDFEVGGNFLLENLGDFNNVLGFKLAFYNNYTKNYLTRSNIIGSSFQQTTNIESALFRGLESSLYFDNGEFYSNLGVNQILQTKFCQKDENLQPGEQKCYKGGIGGSNLSNAVPPKTTLYANIGTRLFKKQLDIGARYSYTSKRFVSIWQPADTPIGETNSAEWDSYSIVDIYANYNPKENLTISAGVDNLANKYYLDANNMGLTPAPGRTFHLSFEYKF